MMAFIDGTHMYIYSCGHRTGDLSMNCSWQHGVSYPCPKCKAKQEQKEIADKLWKEWLDSLEPN